MIVFIEEECAILICYHCNIIYYIILYIIYNNTYNIYIIIYYIILL